MRSYLDPSVEKLELFIQMSNWNRNCSITASRIVYQQNFPNCVDDGFKYVFICPYSFPAEAFILDCFGCFIILSPFSFPFSLSRLLPPSFSLLHRPSLAFYLLLFLLFSLSLFFSPLFTYTNLFSFFFPSQASFPFPSSSNLFLKTPPLCTFANRAYNIRYRLEDRCWTLPSDPFSAPSKARLADLSLFDFSWEKACSWRVRACFCRGCPFPPSLSQAEVRIFEQLSADQKKAALFFHRGFSSVPPVCVIKDAKKDGVQEMVALKELVIFRLWCGKNCRERSCVIINKDNFISYVPMGLLSLLLFYQVIHCTP